MLMKDFNKQYDVTLGNDKDVCFYCLREYHTKNPDQSVVAAKHDLAGNLEYKPIFKNKRIGDGFTICQEHIIKIANELDITPGELTAKAKEAK